VLSAVFGRCSLLALAVVERTRFAERVEPRSRCATLCARTECLLHAHCMRRMMGVTVSGAMKAIQIRRVPDDIHRELRERAAAAGLSLSQYLLAELERIAKTPRIADVLERAAATSPALPTDVIVEAVRAGRDRK